MILVHLGLKETVVLERERLIYRPPVASLVVDGNMGLQLLFALLAVRTCHISYLGGAGKKRRKFLHKKTKKERETKNNGIYPIVGAIEHSGHLHFTSAYSS